MDCPFRTWLQRLPAPPFDRFAILESLLAGGIPKEVEEFIRSTIVSIQQLDVLLLPWPVENTVYHDTAHPSHLLLPVIPDAPETAPVEPPLADINWPLAPGAWMPNTEGWPLTGE